MISTRICAAIVLCAAATTAPATVLYKSIGANGTVEFSDLAPEKGRNVERIRIPDSSPGAAPAPVAAGPSREEARDTDAALARANAQLDLAEHALAEARRAVPPELDALRTVAATRMSRADQDRLDFYKKDVLLARTQLLEILKEKRRAAVPQTLTASNDWIAVSPGTRQ